MKHKFFRSIRDYWYDKYGQRIQKVSIDAGFTCPNRDGTKAIGGCIYCNNDSFNFSPEASIHDQLRIGIERAKKRFGARKFMAYFQAYSNTYGPTEYLEKLYSVVYDFPEVVGLSIGTRPDCVPDEVLQVVERFTQTHEVWMEYGLESSSNDSLRRLNRAHTFEEFEDAVHRTAGRGMMIAAHTIVGLPWESESGMIQTARDVAALPVDAVKIHNLHIVKGTALEQMHVRSPFRLMTLTEYAAITAKILEILPPQLLILRLTADCSTSMLVAPDWCNRRSQIVKAIELELESRGSYQGAFHGRSTTSEIRSSCQQRFVGS